MAIPANFALQLRIHFYYTDNDWVEIYPIQGFTSGDPLAAMLQCRQFCEFRRLWLANDMTMDYASISSVDSAKDGMPVNMYGIQSNAGVPAPLGTGVGGVVNDPKVGLAYRVETAGNPAAVPPLPGRFGTRILGGIPDIWVNGNQWVGVTPPPTPLNPAVGAPALSYTNALNSQGNLVLTGASSANIYNLQCYFLNLLVNGFGILNKVGGRPPTTNWVVIPYSRCVYRDVSSHRRGKSWKDSVARAEKWS